MTNMERAKEILGEEFAFFCEVIAAPLERVQLPKDARILDVGTGRGRVALSLALQGYQVLTGEPAEDHSEYAKQPWREDAKKVGVDQAITYRAFDATKMPFDGAAFDAVFVLGALHHMDDPAAAVSECIRVLAPHGVICILEPTAALLEIARKRYPDHPDATDPMPFLDGMDVESIHQERFDIYIIRRP